MYCMYVHGRCLILKNGGWLKFFNKSKAKLSFVKGSVSRDLRWVLLYINGKLSLRPITALQKF